MLSLADDIPKEGASVAGDGVWRAAFLMAFVLLLAAKILLAVNLPLFGDEAFYWLESRHLAWGYSDLPGMTAWLIALGDAGFGHAKWAVRLLFVLFGSILPWLIVLFARRHFAARAAWQAGLLTLALPLAGSLGVLALPDVVLTVAAMLALLALDVALVSNRWRDWLMLALALVLALASHYRAGMLLLAGLVFALLSPRGRALWSMPRWYAALALGALGAVPALLYNLDHAWAGLTFQTLERNPWAFQADALVQPLEQALVTTPLMYVLLLWVLVQVLGRVRMGAPWDLIASVAGTFLVGYFLLGLFADDQRFRLHWPLPGYLPLLAVVPVLARHLWQAGSHRWLARSFLVTTWMGLALGQLLLLAYLSALCLPPTAAPWLRQHNLADPFDGWKPATELAAGLLDRPGHGEDVLLADNFRLAAELGFGLGGHRPVYSLDSPLNARHGRAVQLAQWGLDEAGVFAAHAGRPALLAVEETALRERQRPSWLGGLCRRFSAIEPLGRVDISPRKRIAFYQVRLRLEASEAPRYRDDCIIWLRAWTMAQMLPTDAGS